MQNAAISICEFFKVLVFYFYASLYILAFTDVFWLLLNHAVVLFLFFHFLLSVDSLLLKHTI